MRLVLLKTLALSVGLMIGHVGCGAPVDEGESSDELNGDEYPPDPNAQPGPVGTDPGPTPTPPVYPEPTSTTTGDPPGPTPYPPAPTGPAVYPPPNTTPPASTLPVPPPTTPPPAPTGSGPAACDDVAPHGCYALMTGGDPSCPEQSPELPWKYAGCNGVPPVGACNYEGPDAKQVNCICDSGIHWLCSYPLF